MPTKFSALPPSQLREFEFMFARLAIVLSGSRTKWMTNLNRRPWVPQAQFGRAQYRSDFCSSPWRTALLLRLLVYRIPASENKWAHDTAPCAPQDCALMFACWIQHHGDTCVHLISQIQNSSVRWTHLACFIFYGIMPHIQPKCP